MLPDIPAAKRSLSCLIQSGAVTLLTVGVAAVTWYAHTQAWHLAWVATGATLLTLLVGAVTLAIRQRVQALAEQGQAWAQRAQLSENQWSAVMAHSADGILTLSQSGHITSANAAIGQMFGTRQISLTGQHISTLIPAAPTSEELAAFLLEHDEPSHLKRPELQGKRHNGRSFPLSLSVCCPASDGDHRFVAIIRDLSATKSMELAMNAAQRHLDAVDEMRRMIVHTAPYAIVILNTHGIIQAINPAGEQLLGYPANDLVGRSDTQRFFDADQVAHRAHLLSTRLNRPIHDLQVLPRLAELSPGHPSEWNLIRADGSTVVAEILVHILTDEAGQHTGYLATAHDVTQRRQAEDKLHHMAMHDALTALPNRNMLQEQLKLCIGLAERNNQPLAMLFIDIDRFKKINDTLGHHIGDSVLIEVGRRIRSAMRTSDIVARLGGDEFGILLPRITTMSDGMLVAEKLHGLFSEPFRVGPHELRISPSIGLALYPDHGTDSITLMRHADLAMYQAKNAGRNRIEVFSDKMQSPTADTLLLENDLYKALELDELRLFFQPQFDCANGAITGMEALLRWEHGGKLIPPNDFIPLAEETGLIVGMGEWVLRRACQRAHAWRSSTGWPLRVAVNLSAVQLEQANILSTIERVLRETGLPPTALELEITESVVVRESLRAADILNQLRALGVSIAIDDFGVGYSSFAYLRELPVDRFKLDRSFLNAVPISEADSRLTSALIAMAHRLDVGIVAEGVETAEQAAFLKDHGCDECQGYHLGRPMPETQFEQLLQSHSQTHRDLLDAVINRTRVRAGRGTQRQPQTT